MKRIGMLLALLCAISCGPLSRAADAAPSPGQKPPVLTLAKLLQAPDGAAANWDKLHGKVVVLEFWATWCGPCVAAIPHLNDLADQFKNKPVQFIAITAEDEAIVSKFLVKKPLHTWIGLDANDATNKAYHVTGIPTTVVIRADGVIDAVTYPTQLRPENLENLLAGEPSGLISRSPRGDSVRVGELPGDNDHASVFQVIIRPSKVDTLEMTSDGASGGGSLGLEMGRTYSGQTVKNLMTSIYECNPQQIVVNGKLPAGKFDLAAKVSLAGRGKMNHLIQEALESTFGLESHRERRMLDVYVVTVDKSSAKVLKPNKGGLSSSGSVNPMVGILEGVNQSMDAVTSVLANQLSCQVIDETNLAGNFDFDVKWDPTATPQAKAQVIAEQLGLTLTPAKRLVEVVVVDAATQGAASPATHAAAR